MDKKYNLLLIIVILTAGVIAYSNSFDCSFHFDDALVIDSRVITDSSTIGDWINLFPTRPLGILTFAANYNIHKLDVWGYHLVNLIIHLINALLIWWLTWITFSTPAMKDELISRHKTVIAFLTGLLFVTHPLATQSVTYIAQRFASLATLFYFLSLILFIKGRLQENNKAALLLFGGSIVAGICGMLTKEIVFTLPFAVILYDYCFIKSFPWKPEAKDKSLIFFSFSMLVIFILLFLRNSSLNVFSTVPPDQGYTYSISMKEYLFTQFSVIWTYIRLFILPVHQNLDYDYAVSKSFFEIKTFFSFLGLLGILSAGVLLFKKYRLIAFGIFWFFLTLSVESSIIPISQNVIFEHRTYLPGFGFFIALTGAFFYLFREQYFKIALIIILLIASINTALTYQRNKIWKNEYTLWSDCLKNSPDKARVNNNLGFALFENNKSEKALYYYNKAILLSPNYFPPYGNRGNAYAKMGKRQPAIENFNKAIALKPDSTEAYYNRGTFYGKAEQYQLAIEDFNKAIRLNGNHIKSYNNRGIAHTGLGLYQKALDDFNEAIRLKPDYADAWNNRAFAYLNLGDNIACCRDARKACELGNCKTLEAAKDKGLCR